MPTAYGSWRKSAAAARWWRVWHAPLRARRRLAEMVSDADVVNIHDCGFETLLPAFKGKRVVWQINDLYYVFQTGVSASSRQSLRNRALKRIILNGEICRRDYRQCHQKCRERVKRCMGRDATVLYCGVEPVGIHATSTRLSAGLTAVGSTCSRAVCGFLTATMRLRSRR